MVTIDCPPQILFVSDNQKDLISKAETKYVSPPPQEILEKLVLSDCILRHFKTEISLDFFLVLDDTGPFPGCQ